MIVRHPDAFYPARGLFSHQIINSLSKLALATNSQLENRKLAIDLAALLVRWEERRIREQKARGGGEAADGAAAPAPAAAPAAAEPAATAGDESPDRKRPREDEPMEDAPAAATAADGAEPPAKQAKGPDGAPVATAAAPAYAAAPAPTDGEYALSPQHADAVLHLLIRVAFVCADAPDREMQALRAYTLKVFRQAAVLFKDAPIRLPWLEKLLQVRGGGGGRVGLIA